MVLIDDIEDHKSFIRLKIRFSASIPLEPGFYYSREDRNAIWISFKYEGLSSFCVRCGLIDHTIGARYQHLAHPHNYALADKMRGFPPSQRGDESTEKGTSQGTSKEGLWKPVVPPSPVGDQNVVRNSVTEPPGRDVGWPGRQHTSALIMNGSLRPFWIVESPLWIGLHVRRLIRDLVIDEQGRGRMTRGLLVIRLYL